MSQYVFGVFPPVSNFCPVGFMLYRSRTPISALKFWGFLLLIFFRNGNFIGFLYVSLRGLQQSCVYNWNTWCWVCVSEVWDVWLLYDFGLGGWGWRRVESHVKGGFVSGRWGYGVCWVPRVPHLHVVDGGDVARLGRWSRNRRRGRPRGGASVSARHFTPVVIVIVLRIHLHLAFTFVSTILQLL